LFDGLFGGGGGGEGAGVEEVGNCDRFVDFAFSRSRAAGWVQADILQVKMVKVSHS
jgi:hypothetical protein